MRQVAQLHNLQSDVQQRILHSQRAVWELFLLLLTAGGNGNTCRTYALLGDGADKSLCDERLLNALNIVSRLGTFQISTVSSTGITNHGYEVVLDVQHVNGKDTVTLQNVWSVKRLSQQR